MKMNATKLTIALVALLLALTCVFAACGKKNNTDKPDDTTPVDNKPVVVDTVAKEDLTAVAESLKAAYAANYVDLYSAETATAIEAEKSVALVKIMAATSKEEAQKVADDFIAYLKSQKTIIDSIAALVEKIGDVSLKDADALNELADVVAKLDAAYAGTNAAKKAALDAYKADAATQKAIKDIVARYDQLKAAKKAADVKDGLNDQIAALKADFTADKKEFGLADFNEYEDLVNAIDAEAAKYKIVAGTEAYDSVYDVVTLKVAKDVLDAAFAKDTVLTKLQALVDAAKVLKVAADEAQWREFVYIAADELKDDSDGTYGTAVILPNGTKKYAKAAIELKDSSTGAYTTSITLPDGAKKYYDGSKLALYATEEAAKKALVDKKFVKIEADITVDYKLSLKDAVETAVAAKDAVFKSYSVDELTLNYAYTNAAGDPVFEAKKYIADTETAYNASVDRAKAAYNTVFVSTVYTNDYAEKDPTIGSYSLQAEFDALNLKIQTKDNKITDNQAAIKAAIDSAKDQFVSKTESGNDKAGGNFYVNDAGDYQAAAGYYFNLKDGKPSIDYVAWTYSYQFEGKQLVVPTTTPFNATKQTKYYVFDVLDELTTPANLTNAQLALRWLAMYIGDGEYADSYNLGEYKDHGAASFAKTDVLYMIDRDITEVATVGVAEIRGTAVGIAKDTTAVDVKVLSPYTIAKALVDEAAKIAEAQDAARADIKAAALALRAAGDANAVVDAKTLLDEIESGEYVAAKLGYTFSKLSAAKQNLLKVNDADTTTDVVLQTKPSKVEKAGKAIINDAYNALKAAIDALTTAEAAHTGTYVEVVTLMNAYGIALPDTSYNAGYTFTTPAFTAKSISDYAVLQKKLATYEGIYADYVAEAKRLNKVAEEGVAAYVIPKAGDANNTGSTETAKNLKRIQNIQALFTSYEAFEYYYLTDKYFENGGTPIAAADLKTTAPDNVNALLTPFQGATSASKHTALVGFIDELLASIKADPADSAKTVIKNGSEFVNEYKAKVEEAFAEELDAYKGVKGLLASDAFAANAKITAAKNAITNFANNYYTDYVNLKVSIPFGEDKLDYDFLTEVFRETLLANSQKVIDNVIAYADGLDSNLTNTATDANVLALADWKTTVGNRVNDMSVAFDAVTSIATADKNVSITNLKPEDYALNVAANKLSKDVAVIKTAAFAN